MARARLLVLPFAALVLALFAGPAGAAITPSATADTSAVGSTSMSFTGTVDPKGLASTYWVNYFGKDQTDNCNFPDASDLLNVAQSAHFSLDGSETPAQATVTVSGLPHETEYCYSWHIEETANSANSYDDLYWFNYTTSDPPTLANATFDSQSTAIDYSVDLTPNATVYPTNLRVEYFAKGPEACADFAGTVSTKDEYGGEANNWAGWKGFSPTTVSATVDGLAQNTAYCIRLVGVSAYGESAPTAWQQLSTVQPVASTVDVVKIGAYSGGDPNVDATLTVSVDDRGAAADTGNANDLRVVSFQVTVPGQPSRCNDTEYFGGAQQLDESSTFSGASTSLINLVGLTVGNEYCITVFVESAWGDAYDTTVHIPVFYGENPTVATSGPTATANSISMGSVVVGPGQLATSYAVESYVKRNPDCGIDAPSDGSSGAGGEITTGLTYDHALGTLTINGLDANTRYCVRVVADNGWASAASAWTEQKTRYQQAPPTVSNFEVAPPSGPGAQLTIKADLDDHDASADTGQTTAWFLNVYSATTAACEPNLGSSGPGIVSDSGGFNGTASIATNFTGLEVGGSYCAVFEVNPGWVTQMTDFAFPFVMPGAPAVSAVAAVKTDSSIAFSGDVAAHGSATDVSVGLAPKGPGACSGAGASTVYLGKLTSPLDAPASYSHAFTGLAPSTSYCLRFAATNSWGANTVDWTVVKTKPSAPSGLVVSGQTDSAATLSWSAPADPTGVDHYLVKGDAGAVASASATSVSVSIACASSDHLRVVAVDADGNESAESSSVLLTGTACPLPPAKPVVAFKKLTKTIKAKDKRGKSITIKVTGTPSKDGSSITLKVKAPKSASAALYLGKKRLGKRVKVTKPGTYTVVYTSNGRKRKSRVKINNNAR